MAQSNRLKNQHLLWRAGFGPMIEIVESLDTMTPSDLWSLLLKTSSQKPNKIIVTNYANIDAKTETLNKEKKDNKKEINKIFREQSKDEIKDLNILWLNEMINSKAQLLEKMSLFWHGHFASRVVNSYFQQELLQIIRENALGNFKDLLIAVSKSASMISFLNNQQNKKKHPNENFAREVMELFTLGRGNYSETDVKEAARAFTGWGINIDGEFEFRNFFHDSDNKTIFNQTGNFDGNDVLNILLAKKQTAIFITKKIYQYFVNDNVDAEKIEWLASRFYKNNYEIKPLLEDIFTSNWFFYEINIGTKIKSPIDLIVGIRRLLPMQMENDQAQILFQKTLGQVLFFPPNVAGWPGGKSWIDSSSLMLRLRLAQIFSANDIMDIKPKQDDDTMMGQMMMEETIKKLQQTVKGATAKIDWALVVNIFESTKKENILQKITTIVLQTKDHVNNVIIQKYLNTDSRENYIKSSFINLMSTLEYQLC